MTPDFYLCDVCGDKVSEDDRLFIATDYTFNGVENVADGKTVDLCHHHLCEVLAALCGCGAGRVTNFEMGKRVLDIIKKLK